jgi:hypothetical protein
MTGGLKGMGNIFLEALALIRSKKLEEMTEEEIMTVHAASIPLDLIPEFGEMTKEQGLEMLASVVKLRDDVQEIWERLFRGQIVAAGKQSMGKCDFNCKKTGEPIIAFRNGNGHTWLCHISCLQEQVDLYRLLEGGLPQTEQ